MKYVCLLGLSLFAAVAMAQLPVHQLYRISVSESDGALSLGDPKQLTKDAVYQNQPEFLPNGDLLYTAFDPSSNQTDIMRYRAADGVIEKVLDTPLSEYSPTVMPDGRHFSVVRVEADGAQKLYQVALNSGAEQVIVPRARMVGYHAWVPQNRLAIFLVTGKPRLLVSDPQLEDFEDVFENVGRCIKTVPGTAFFSTVHKARPAEWYVRAVKGRGAEIEDWFATLPGSEDYVWLDANRMLMAKDGAIHLYDRSNDLGWQMVRDFNSDGLDSITRMALSADGKQLVVVEGVN